MIANASHLRSQTGRIGIAVTAPEAEAELNYSWLALHACRHLGNARRPFSRIADWLTGWLGDDMDAATRRRFA